VVTLKLSFEDLITDLPLFLIIAITEFINIYLAYIGWSNNPIVALLPLISVNLMYAMLLHMWHTISTREKELQNNKDDGHSKEGA
jgi:fumarate reductase subunit C